LETTSDEFRQLIFDDFKGAFAILISGCAIGLFSFLTELLLLLLKREYFIFLRNEKKKFLFYKL